MKCVLRILVLLGGLATSTTTLWSQAGVAPSSCPITFLRFDPAGLSAKVENVSGKQIVGLTFFAALADATEHWRWVLRDEVGYGPLREFNWNRAMKPGDKKGMSWDRTNLDFDHGGGGVFILSSALYADGTSWEARPDESACRTVWYNSHKKSFTRPIQLPPAR